MSSMFEKIASLEEGEALLLGLGPKGMYALGQLDQARLACKRAKKKLRNATLALQAAQFWMADHAGKAISQARLALEKTRKTALFDFARVSIELTERRHRKLRKAFFAAHPEIKLALSSTRATGRRLAA